VARNIPHPGKPCNHNASKTKFFQLAETKPVSKLHWLRGGRAPRQAGLQPASERTSVRLSSADLPFARCLEGTGLKCEDETMKTQQLSAVLIRAIEPSSGVSLSPNRRTQTSGSRQCTEHVPIPAWLSEPPPGRLSDQMTNECLRMSPRCKMATGTSDTRSRAEITLTLAESPKLPSTAETKRIASQP
jgi:hypothetical protein